MKKHLQMVLLTALSVIAVFAVVTWSSCNSDKCKAIACANGGVCHEGVCTCPDGFDGPSCERTVRDRFIGSYTVFEKGTRTNVARYPVVINPGTNMPDVKIKNFYNALVSDVQAYVRGDSIYIPLQRVDKYELQGIGKLDQIDPYYGINGRITLKYYIRDTNDAINYYNDFGLNSGDASVWNK